MEKNIKNIRNEFKANGIFYTSSELADLLKKYIPGKPRRVYDPTCGQGNLLYAFDSDVEKYGQELFQDELDKATERLENFHGYCGDTLVDDGFAGELFDTIVANPPFSIKWTPPASDPRFDVAPCTPPPGKADYAFILHILHHLSDDGVAVCLEFPGILYRGQREGKIRQWLVEQNYIERVVAVPGKQFVDTAIATCVLVFRKNKDTTDITFEDLETGKELTVPVDAVKENGYNLSVNQYVVREVERPPFDPVATEAEARRALLTHLEYDIQFSATIARLDPNMPPLEDFLDDIQAIVDKYRSLSAVGQNASWERRTNE